MVAWLASHSGLGSVRLVEDVPNWLRGARQRVSTTKGQSLLFYMEGGDVVTVYEDVNGDRREVWRRK